MTTGRLGGEVLESRVSGPRIPGGRDARRDARAPSGLAGRLGVGGTCERGILLLRGLGLQVRLGEFAPVAHPLIGRQ